MWNSIFPNNKSTYYSYSTKKKEELAKLSKYKLFIMLITRHTYRIMTQSISHIHTTTKKQYTILERMFNIMRKSAYQSTQLSWLKLKQNVIISRSKQQNLRNLNVLLERMTKYKLKKTFSTIFLFGQRKNDIMIRNIEQMRKIVFCRKIQKIFQNKKKSHLNQINTFSAFQKKLLKKVKIIGIISSQYLKNVKQACFNRLSKNNNPKTVRPPIRNLRQQSQNKQLKIKLNDMQVQLQNKNQSISRLEQQIQRLKSEQPTNNYNSFSQYTVLANNLNRSRSNQYVNNNSRIKKGSNQSYDSGLDFSLGSILGNSFSLNKSRSRDLRKGDSIASIDCNCGYKQRCIKYKNSNESLKNQLQIVKQELQVAKDLNDHFTNEIRQYFGGQKNQIQLDRLRKQTKDLQRDRDELRMKVTKYQNHITTLKSQFKSKIEQLYRKVKKQR